MLDQDLADLYQVETKSLNRSVRRNIVRFPGDFAFELTPDEWGVLRCQNGTLKNPGSGTHRKYLPFVFTEQGVAMLAGILSSLQAIQANIAIIRTFVRLRQMLESNKELSRKLSELETKYDRQFKAVFDAIREIMTDRSVPRKQIIGLGKPD